MSETSKEAKDTMEKIGKEYPQFIAAFNRLMHEGLKKGSVDEKTKELISIAVAVSKQCDWCIHLHVNKALELGASRDEIMESCFVPVMMGGGPSLMYLKEVMDALENA